METTVDGIIISNVPIHQVKTARLFEQTRQKSLKSVGIPISSETRVWDPIRLITKPDV